MAGLDEKKIVSGSKKVRGVFEIHPEAPNAEIISTDIDLKLSRIQEIHVSLIKNRQEQIKLVDLKNDLLKELSVSYLMGKSLIRGFFGPDSIEYDQAGGKRSSERKPYTRKPKNTTKESPEPQVEV
jgi:hypothetical protein